ncbi:MAG: N-formylglutamate amidohydrolase [Tenacibaculum sp.]
MVRLSIAEIINNIKKEKSFNAVSSNYTFSLKIDSYVPYVCAAVHDGHQFRKELWGNCLHTDYERWYEEDPATRQMIQSHPIVIAGLDSRFEYDLNRPPKTALYTNAWGKKLWKEPLSEQTKATSLQKHTDFYKVVKVLIKKIEEKFTSCVVYDMHSYNWQRWDRQVPIWNLGTANIDTDRFGCEIEAWRSCLEKTPMPNGLVSSSKINDTFKGDGYFLKFITKNFKNTLVLATEIAKIYCNELTQVLYPEIIYAVEEYLKTALKQHAKNFYQKHRQ